MFACKSIIRLTFVWCVIFVYNESCILLYCNAVSQCVDESMEQDDTFFDVANLKIILTVFVFTSYNVFHA